MRFDISPVKWYGGSTQIYTAASTWKGEETTGNSAHQHRELGKSVSRAEVAEVPRRLPANHISANESFMCATPPRMAITVQASADQQYGNVVPERLVVFLQVGRRAIICSTKNELYEHHSRSGTTLPYCWSA